jgi:hypothetical protein
MPISSGSLIIVTQLKADCRLHSPAVLLVYILKKKTSTKFAYYSNGVSVSCVK